MTLIVHWIESLDQTRRERNGYKVGDRSDIPVETRTAYGNRAADAHQLPDG
ncbi:hypothetical protein [Sanguibacter suaedae]|uniref:Uncharacterized protein n=1 Tax=Sanguibacter suaedae TaxID=2795737 RepID=A0A934M8L2_9MICO|nr:hypothetical protein [Sanguibacter suaedae]MBI9113698.1 hypothetical protein [Sanguibacter suaedae]